MSPRALIVLALAVAGCKDSAELDPASLPPPGDLVDLLERTLPGVPSALTRARVLVGVADGELGAGSPAAKARLTAATVATREVDQPSAQSSLRARLVDLWCRVGDIETARTVAEEISGEELRSEARVSLTRALVKTGHLDAAEAVARSVKVDRHRGAALLEVVRGHLAEGHRPAAGKLIAAFRGLHERDEALSEVAAAYARARDLAPVHGAIDDIRSPHWRGAARAALALAHFRRKHRRRALEAVGEIESEWMRVRGTMGLYAEARRRGRGRAAKRLLASAEKRAGAIEDRLMRSSAWAEIIDQFARLGAFEDAEARLSRIEDVTSRRKAEADLVGRLADVGRFDEASRLLGAVEADALWGGVAADRLARALAEAGRIGPALDAVGRIRALDLRLPALGYVAALQASLGQAPEASWLDASRALLDMK